MNNCHNLLGCNTLVIGLGYKAHHGKDSVAKVIMNEFGDEYDIERYAFADELKIELYDALCDPHDPYWATTGDYLTLPHPSEPQATNGEKLQWVNEEKSKLGIHLQLYGTEYRRRQTPFYWINRVRQHIRLDKPQIALITDVRFPNELQFVKACAGYAVKVERIGYTASDRDPNHISETALDGFQFDIHLQIANGDLEDLHSSAVELFSHIIVSQQPCLPEIADGLSVHASQG